MINAKQVAEAVNRIAPFDTQMDMDNCGLLIDCANETDKILVVLDVTEQTIQQAQENGCGIIVSHHPLMYHPIQKLSVGSAELLAVRAGISVIAAHTCWDAADGGVNDVLAQKLKLLNVRTLCGLGRIGDLPDAADAHGFADDVKRALGCGTVTLVDGGREIRTVAVVGGAAGMIDEIIASGAQAFLTGEIKHHEALAARRAGLTVVAAGHFETEAVSLVPLAEKLRESCGEQVIVAKEISPTEYV